MRLMMTLAVGGTWLALTACGTRESAPPPAHALAPDLGRSFLESTARLVLVGDGWALEAYVQDSSFLIIDDAATPRTFDFVPIDALLYRLGPDDANRFVVSAGPLNPRAASRRQLPHATASGLRIRIVVLKAGRDLATDVEITLSGFECDGVRYAAVGPICIRVLTPLP